MVYIYNKAIIIAIDIAIAITHYYIHYIILAIITEDTTSFSSYYATPFCYSVMYIHTWHIMPLLLLVIA